MGSQHIKNAVEILFTTIRSGASPEEISRLFSENVDWYIAGDLKNVPWIGKKIGRKGVVEFFQEIQEMAISESFEIEDILSNERRALVLGNLKTKVKSTGKLIETKFVFEIIVQDGLITKYHMLEDSFAVSNALK